MAIDYHRIDDLSRRAIKAWGIKAQLEMMVEECSELLLELARIPRARHSNEDILEESVDVHVMTRQMFIIFGETRAEEILNKKMDRLESRLKKYEHE